MRLSEVLVDHNTLRKFLLKVSKFAPGPFKLINTDIYVSEDPKDKNVKLIVAPGSTWIHVKLEHPDTHEAHERFKDFATWYLRTNAKHVSGLNSKTEKYENHPGMVFITFRYDDTTPSSKRLLFLDAVL